MIVKKIPARPAVRDATIGRALHARRLIDYLRLPEKKSAEKDYMVEYMLGQKLGNTSGERLFHIGARGFISETIEGQRAEMIAIAQEAYRSPNPVDHWLLSWRHDELPTADQVDETVAIFVEHLGVAGQPCIYACHGDTHNRHVHIALNRYDPLARRMIEINDGFNLEAAHQAVALIVDRFEWAAETEARYEVVGDSVVLTNSAKERIAEGREPIRQAAAASENRTGYSSAQRIAQDHALPLIVAARSWAELHTSLAAAGMKYELVGTNGATITVGDQPVNASSVARTVTRTRLEQRFGRSFEARDPKLPIAVRSADGDRMPNAFRADEYRAECERWQKHEATEREAGKGRAAGVPETITDIARAAARARAPLKRPPPDLESWYYAQREGVFAERWRNRLRVPDLFALAGTERGEAVLPAEIDGYVAYACSDGTRYARGPAEPTAFIDRGNRIEIVSSEDDALLAALRLAVLKFDGQVSVSGDAEYRERVYAIGQAHGLVQAFADADFVERRAAEVGRQATDVPRKSIMDQARDAGERPVTASKRPVVQESDLPPKPVGRGR